MSLKDSQELKQLQSRETKLSTELKHLSEEDVSIQRKLAKERRRLATLKKKISSLKQKSAVPIVSEHAILRYIERTMGVDVEHLKQEILTDKVLDQFKVLGSGKYPTTGGCKAVIKDGVVVTVI